MCPGGDRGAQSKRFAMQASNLVGQIEDSDLLVRYQACYARIADSKRRFLGAAMKYYELSQDSTGKACAAACSTVGCVLRRRCVHVLCMCVRSVGARVCMPLQILARDGGV